MYPLCDPWNGAMGPSFERKWERKFKPDFLAGTAPITEKQATSTYTDEDQRVRLLSVVMGCKAHPDINAAARKELIDPSDRCRVGGVRAGVPDYALTLQMIDEMWVSYFTAQSYFIMACNST